jgi:hypothetical protein
VTSILETNLTIQGNRMNIITKKVTGWAAIIAIPTLITGFLPHFQAQGLAVRPKESRCSASHPQRDGLGREDEGHRIGEPARVARGGPVPGRCRCDAVRASGPSFSSAEPAYARAMALAVLPEAA